MRIEMARPRSILWTISLCLATDLYVSEPSARAETSPVAAAGDSQEQFFSYPLRTGESLNGVSQIFGVPVQALIELNQIHDPNQLQLGQTLKVPNSLASSFARDAEALRTERDRLLGEKRRAEGQSAERQRAMASMDSQLRQLDADKAVLGRELTARAQWERAAKLLSFLVLAVFCWALKARAERAKFRRKLNLLAAENTVLAAARERYREAASQLELRYQKLYDRKGDAPRKVIAAGISRLDDIFGEGTAEIERLVANLGTEREKEKRSLESAPWAFAWVFHRARETLLRQRLKYHTP